MSQRECFFPTKVIVNGIIFSMELWLPNFVDIQNRKINEIIDIVMLELNDINKIFVICKTYHSVAYDEHYGCYRVEIESLQKEVSIININEFLSQHYYPVKIHHIQNNYLFRCKHF